MTPKVANTSAAALAMIQMQAFDTIILDWRELDNRAEFRCAVRRSKLNHDCVLVAVVRDLLDLKQVFAEGVHFLIHKPPSALQIERCLRAAYSSTVARRRRHHREPVQVVASGLRSIRKCFSRACYQASEKRSTCASRCLGSGEILDVNGIVADEACHSRRQIEVEIEHEPGKARVDSCR